MIKRISTRECEEQGAAERNVEIKSKTVQKSLQPTQDGIQPSGRHLVREDWLIMILPERLGTHVVRSHTQKTLIWHRRCSTEVGSCRYWGRVWYQEQLRAKTQSMQVPRGSEARNAAQSMTTKGTTDIANINRKK
jgi:hypothetical protein